MGKAFDYPVWGTQGGGLVRETQPGEFIFVEKPDCPGLDVGDNMPREWDIQPANELAREEAKISEFGPVHQAMFDADVELMFDMLFDNAKAGKLSFDEVARFIPEDVRKRNETRWAAKNS